MVLAILCAGLVVGTLAHAPDAPALRPTTLSDSVVFYIAPKGNDAWSGRLPAPTSDNSDGPFASFPRAQTAVRSSLASGLHPSVHIRQGNYRFTTTLVLGPKDSGQPGKRITWQASPGETVSCSGGITLGGFKPIRDTRILHRLPVSVRHLVRVTNLRAQAITDIGELPGRVNLFFRGKRMPLARFPNAGWLTIARVPQIEENILNPGDKKVLKEGLPAGRHSGMFQYDGDRPSRWNDH